LYALLVARAGDETVKLARDLSKLGIDCAVFSEPGAALASADTKTPAALLVELAFSPDVERLCQHLKNSKKVPVVILTDPGRLAVLSPAADDFILRPYRAEEIAVRLERLRRLRLPAAGSDRITAGNLVIDTTRYEVYRDGLLIELTFKEYELLKLLASNPGRVFTRNALLNQIWGEDYFGGDRTVDVHIRRLRGKIEGNGRTYIDTVRNIGYRFKKF